MFGYVTADKPNMLIKDFTMYRAFYCGICVSMGKRYGQFKRLLTNYDVTFLAIFLHAVMEQKVEHKISGCILNPFKKKVIIKNNNLMDRICDITVLLAAYKIKDNISDEGGIKHRLLGRILKKAIKKAKRREKYISDVISDSVIKLNILEKTKCDNIDELAHPFALMLKNIGGYVLEDKADEYILNVFYNLGRWIYIIDAIDDVESDFKKGNFNPLISSIGEFKDKKSFLELYKNDLTFLINSAYNAIKHNYEFIELEMYEGIITNILWYGLLENGRIVLEGCKKEKLKLKS